MKNLKIKSIIIIFLSVIGLSFSMAKNPDYKLTTENLNRVAPNAIEFDIYLQHINPDETKFEYILGQYFFDFNPEIANGGKLTYSLISSDLPSSLQPRNPTVSGNLLRLITNSVPTKESLPLISEKLPGTLVARMRLETSAESFSDASLNLNLRVGPENPFTKVMSYMDNRIVDVTNQQEVAEVVSSDRLSEVISNTEIPKEFTLLQNYPNPFNPSTRINYELPIANYVTLKIYDVVGKEVATLVNEKQNAGRYSVEFDGSSFASGIYFYRIKAGDPSSGSGHGILQTMRMILIK